MDTKISKENVLKLLKRKRDGTLNSSFKQLEMETGYSKGHLKKLYKQLATEILKPYLNIKIQATPLTMLPVTMR